MGSPNIGSENTGPQSEDRIVGHGNGFLLAFEGEHRHDRPEQFHLGAADRLAVTTKDCRLEVPAGVESLGPFPAGVHSGSLVPRFGHHCFDPVPLGLGGQRTHLGVLVEGVTDANGLGPPDQPLEELVVDSGLHKHP